MARCGQDLGFLQSRNCLGSLALKLKANRCGFSQKKENGVIRLGFGIRILGIFLG